MFGFACCTSRVGLDIREEEHVVGVVRGPSDNYADLDVVLPEVDGELALSSDWQYEVSHTHSDMDVMRVATDREDSKRIATPSTGTSEGSDEVEQPCGQGSEGIRRFLSTASVGMVAVDELAKLAVTASRRLSQQFSLGRSPATSEGASATRPDFGGTWVCIDTWGLDTFLQNMGLSWLKRTAALKAPWPEWHFQQDGDEFAFTNHTALGDLRERFCTDGATYASTDGYKQQLSSRAFWEGDVLVIERSGPQGQFREERLIDEAGHLRFTLRNLSVAASGPCDSITPGVCWGRTFARFEANSIAGNRKAGGFLKRFSQ